MKKYLTVIATAALFTGCTGVNNIKPGNLTAALSQDNASDSIDAVTPYGDISIRRSVPNAVNTTPIAPLTADQLAAVQADPIASFVYGLSKDPASVDFQWHGVGGNVVFHRAMPPNVLGTNQLQPPQP